MEKGTPHCKLSVVKTLVMAGKVRTTASAVIDARLLGFDRAGVIELVLALAPGDFYKSMTTFADHTIWQDVYHRSTPAGDVYLKLTVIDDVLTMY